MNDAAGDELVFVPQVGFRLAHGGLQSDNVVVERDGETFTAGLTSDRDGTDLRITIAGVDVELDFRHPLELRPGRRLSWTRDVHREAVVRERSNERDHMPGDTAVERLRGDQETAWLSHLHEGYCSILPKQ